MAKRIVLLIAGLLLTSSALAHEIHTESEYDFAPIMQPNNAKSIVGYLAAGEVDIYELLVSPADVAFGPTFIVANVLPPACKQYKNFYPDVALVGYGLPQPTVELPMALPPGMGAIVVPGRRVKKDTRPIYTTAAEEMNHMIDEFAAQCAAEGVVLEHVYGNVSWFLPHGVTQQCLHCTPWFCPMDDTLFAPVFAPGMYQLWVFNSTGRHGDYNLSVGTGEEGETCEGIARTSELFRQIVDDELFVLPHCVEAGVSGFETCDGMGLY